MSSSEGYSVTFGLVGTFQNNTIVTDYPSDHKQTGLTVCLYDGRMEG
jgi:hypothetical protein